jgi:hypothetical protein
MKAMLVSFAVGLPVGPRVRAPHQFLVFYDKVRLDSASSRKLYC